MPKTKKTTLVTGAAKAGYGEATTRRLLADGYDVFGSFEPEDAARAETLLKEFKDGSLRLSRCDHASRQDLLRLCKTVPTPVAGVVNGQFAFAMEDLAEFDYDAWDRSLAVNLSAPNLIARELQDRFAPGSSIVTVTSTEGFVGSFGASAYAATKAAVHNLTKSLANVLGSKAVRVNAVAAGWIGGVMDTDEVFNLSRKITPLKRLGKPEEIAAVVAFLLSDEASFINGTVVTADGGYSGVDTIALYEFEQAQKQAK